MLIAQFEDVTYSADQEFLLPDRGKLVNQSTTGWTFLAGETKLRATESNIDLDQGTTACVVQSLW